MANRTKPGKLGPCRCSIFEVGTTTDGPEGTEPEVTIETTGCDRQTPRLFAQGHDAKLVSFLVRAEMAGKEVRYGRAEGVVVTSDAVTACKSVSEALGVKVAAMLAKAQERAAKKATRQPKPAPRVAAIKVGKHVYAGAEIDPGTGAATYKTRAGETKTVEAGKYAIQEAAGQSVD